jgi:hypothetical protein
MRVMAFDPPPPQPIALIFAGAVENIDFDILSYLLTISKIYLLGPKEFLYESITLFAVPGLLFASQVGFPPVLIAQSSNPTPVAFAGS